MQPNIAQNQLYGAADAPQAQSPQSQNVVEYARQRMPSKPDFNSYYDEHIKSLVEAAAVPIEKKESRGNSLFVVVISIVMLGGFGIGVIGPNKVTAAIAAFPMFEQFSGSLLALFIPILVIAVLYFTIRAFRSHASGLNKNRPARGNEKLNSIILPEIFKYLNNGCTYNRNAALTNDDQDILGLDTKRFIWECRNEVVGVHSGTAFKMMELEIQEKAKAGNAFQDSDDAFYKGVYLLLNVPKSFSGRVDINRGQNAVRNASADTDSNMGRVRLEDPNFERLFEVFADDQIEACYLLTTNKIQCLERLRILFGGSELEGSFYNGKLGLLIDCPGNLFDVEPGLHAEEYRAEALKIIGDLDSIFQVIDAMDLK